MALPAMQCTVSHHLIGNARRTIWQDRCIGYAELGANFAWMHARLQSPQLPCTRLDNGQHGESGVGDLS